MARPKRVPGERPLFWMGSSKNDLLAFPEPVQDEIGTALSVAQFGGRHRSAKPWRGEGPVFEVVEDHRGDKDPPPLGVGSLKEHANLLARQTEAHPRGHASGRDAGKEKAREHQCHHARS